MAIPSIPGYLTRPEASKVFNRSQRALERDLEEAHLLQEEEILSEFKLRTKDVQIRPAQEVTTEIVNHLQKEGMNPAWFVSETWLEATYGKRGDPVPRISTAKQSA